MCRVGVVSGVLGRVTAVKKNLKRSNCSPTSDSGGRGEWLQLNLKLTNCSPNWLKSLPPNQELDSRAEAKLQYYDISVPQWISVCSTDLPLVDIKQAYRSNPKSQNRGFCYCWHIVYHWSGIILFCNFYPSPYPWQKTCQPKITDNSFWNKDTFEIMNFVMTFR